MTIILSIAIFGSFLLLLAIGVISTALRYLRYRRRGIRPPRLLTRDVALLIGLAIPFVVITAVRAFSLQPLVTADGDPFVWYLLLTGIPPVVGMAVYCWFEIRVIEKRR